MREETFLTKDCPREKSYFMIDREIDKIPTTYSYSKDELLNSLRIERFQISKVSIAYVQQNWLIVGKKSKNRINSYDGSCYHRIWAT